jgi:TRAP-type C4-dicarboxylate transport system substrate-binding protein
MKKDERGVLLMKRKLALIFAVIFVFVAIAGPATAAPTVLRFAGQSPPDHPATKTMQAMAKEIKDKTNGRVEVKVYPANQLGDYTLVYEEQIRGTIDMSMISIPSQFDSRLELVYINGYVRGYDDVKRVFDPSGWLFKKMNSLTEPLGVKLLGFFIEGMIGTGSTKPAKEPLNPKVSKGLLVRVPNMDVYKMGADAMGYRTVTIPYADVYQSLQTGVCDGVNGYPVAAACTIVGDVIKYWYNTCYSVECLNILISDKTWKKLSAEDQKVLADVANKYTFESIKNAEKSDNYYMDLMEKKGIKVFRYTQQELTPLAEACATTWDALGKKGMTPELIKEFKKELAPKK